MSKLSLIFFFTILSHLINPLCASNPYDTTVCYGIPKISFFFVRHGVTDWGPDDILKGPTDYALNKKGEIQAQKAASELKEAFKANLSPPILITSPLKRAKETGAIIAKSFGIITEEVADFKERYYGDHRLTADIKVTPPDAETDQIFQARVVKALRNSLKKHKPNPIIIVSHQKVFQFLCKILTGENKRLNHGEIYKFDADTFKISDINHPDIK